MVRVHARSWRATYAGLLPAAVIDDVVKSRPARIDRWRTWLSQREERRGSFVATVDGRVVGFVFWGPSREPDATSDTAEVNAIYLDPGVVGRGIGRALLDTAVGDVVANRFAAAVLWVLDTNERARRFYEAAGWMPDGQTKDENRLGATLHEVRYRRSLGVDVVSSSKQA
jgi:L-amino acid N-acyltransferase YncA